MRTRAAILQELHTPWSVEEIELDPPKAGEVLVKLAASGLCHSDEHIVTGDLAGAAPGPPMVGGHEGAGVVLEVGAGVELARSPATTSCSASSRPAGAASVRHGPLQPVRQRRRSRPACRSVDGTSRHHTLDGLDLGLMCLLGTFAEHTVVHESSCVKIEKDWPLDKACLLGCGVVTGWGSAVYAADVQPGEYVAVVGIGGIGANAVQGARMAGARAIAAIDPVEFKREKAKMFGATHTLLVDRRGDRAARRVDVGPWLRQGDHDDGRRQRRRARRGVLARRQALARSSSPTSTRRARRRSTMPGAMLTLFEKQLVGSLFGSANIRKDIPRLMELYTQGQLNLDDLITRTYTLDQINEGYDDDAQRREHPRRHPVRLSRAAAQGSTGNEATHQRVASPDSNR